MLKGGITLSADGIKKKKKKSKKKKKRKRGLDANDESRDPQSGTTKDSRTKAERDYDEINEARELERLKKMAKVSHREKINQFNQYLANLSEHHDVPKVGNAGMG